MTNEPGDVLPPLLADLLRRSLMPSVLYPGDMTRPGLEAMMADFVDRVMRRGKETYAKPLTSFDGRDSMQEAYEEILDAAVYVKKHLVERDESRAEEPTLMADLQTLINVWKREPCSAEAGRRVQDAEVILAAAQDRIRMRRERAMWLLSDPGLHDA